MDDVLIVGGGPVGLVAAIGLARRGLQVRIVEAEPGVLPAPRAMGYARQVLDNLMLLDLFDDATKVGFRSNEMSFRIFKTDEGFVSRSSFPEDIDHPYVLTVAIDELTRLFISHLDRYPQITCTWGTRFVGLTQYDDHVRAEVEGEDGIETIRAKWVIGADGGRSRVRKAIGQELIGYTWPDRFVATNMRFDFEGHGWHPVGNWMIDNQYGGIILRLTRDGQWRVTFHEDGRLPLEGLEQRIFDYYRAVLPAKGEGAQLDLFSPYSMHQRCVEKMRVGRVMLAGDSAHVTNPTSGFGLTGGVFDACTLVDVLAAVEKDGADERLLDAYADARRKVFLEVSSPISCETKRRTFHLTDAEIYAERERQIEASKKGLGWGSGSRSYYSVQLETPSLVTGRTSAEERLAKLGRGPMVWEPEGGFA